jgi:hypothetical protein
MRTTVTLADDVAAAVQQLRRERGTGVSEAVNELVRRGLASPVEVQAFRQRTDAMGEPLLPIDDVAALLETLDGASSR